MPFALLFAGVLFLVVAVRNQQTAFVQLVRSDFSGPGNFMYWVVALLVVGAIGYIPKAKPISNMLLVLILLVLILKRGNSNGAHGGVFQQLTAALGATNTTAQNTTVSSLIGTAAQTASSLAG